MSIVFGSLEAAAVLRADRNREKIKDLQEELGEVRREIEDKDNYFDDLCMDEETATDDEQIGIDIEKNAIVKRLVILRNYEAKLAYQIKKLGGTP